MRAIRRGIGPAAHRLAGSPAGLDRTLTQHRSLGHGVDGLSRLAGAPVDLGALEAVLAGVDDGSPLEPELGRRPQASRWDARGLRQDAGAVQRSATSGAPPVRAAPHGEPRLLAVAPRPRAATGHFGAFYDTLVTDEPPASSSYRGSTPGTVRTPAAAGVRDTAPAPAPSTGMAENYVARPASQPSPVGHGSSAPPPLVAASPVGGPPAARAPGALADLVSRAASAPALTKGSTPAVAPPETWPAASPALAALHREGRRPMPTVGLVEVSVGEAPAVPAHPYGSPTAPTGLPGGPVVHLDMLELAVDEIIAREAERHGLSGVV